jgi:hypothetical protein
LTLGVGGAGHAALGTGGAGGVVPEEAGLALGADGAGVAEGAVCETRVAELGVGVAVGAVGAGGEALVYEEEEGREAGLAVGEGCA